jgi:hypothetical protein
MWHVASEISSGALRPLLEKFNPGDVEEVHAVYAGAAKCPIECEPSLNMSQVH